MRDSAEFTVSAALLDWYDRHAREMPWRVGPAQRADGVQPDPYRVWVAEVMLVPTMPDSFIQNPEQYERAVRFATIDADRPAADIMSNPVFVNSNSTVEEAFIKMKQLKLSGLPVVNKHYRVIGYITMLQILRMYFPQGEEG